MTTLTVTGQVLAGRYELARFLAGGSMGEVWLANDNRMQRTVAVKVLRPEYARDPVAVERFRTEARLAARLTHPGIARVHDVGDDTGSDEPAWMVQEYVPGRPLSELIAAGPLPPLQVADLIAQAAEAVQAAHEVGVVHRDLTPGNLLVTAEGVVKITDFGIARAAGQVPLTATGHVLGAAAYLSPEQVRGRPATPASDVYTLGVVLHECLSGARPFSGATVIDVAKAHLDQDPPPLPSTVPDVLRVVAVTAMAKDPADRPASAAELATHLRSVLADGGEPRPAARPPSAETTSSGQTKPLPRPRHATPPEETANDLRPPVEPPTVTPASTESGTLRGAAAVRLAPQAVAPPSSPTLARAGDLWQAWWAGVSTQVRTLWRRYPISRAGLTGIVMVVLAIVAVIAGANDANGAPAPNTSGPEAGTVRVDDEPGKGWE